LIPQAAAIMIRLKNAADQYFPDLIYFFLL
jgi:hypothetical protein